MAKKRYKQPLKKAKKQFRRGANRHHRFNEPLKNQRAGVWL